MLKGYKNNQDYVPCKGDKVKKHSNATYAVPSNIHVGTIVTVIDVKELATSYSVKMTDRYGAAMWCSSMHMDLVEESKEQVVTINDQSTHVCILNNKSIGSFPDEIAAKTFAKNIVEKNIKNQVIVCEILTVAKVKKPEVMFV